MRSRHARQRRATRAAAATLLLITALAAASEQDKISDTAHAPAGSRPAAVPTAPAGSDGLNMERLKRQRMPVRKTDLFGAKSWYVPPPPPPTGPPPVPTAPPLPFTFIGKIQESAGKLTIFLASANRVYLVSAGETIEDTYHVDGIEDGKLALTYLPLKIKQFLDMGETP